MKYFVSSDIHGFFDEWMLALRSKNFDIDNPEHSIIVCGDLFDRGRQPKQIIDFILSHREKIIVIRGNHEDLLQAMIKRNRNTSMDLSNGTAQTMVDLCSEWLISKFDLSEIAEETGIQEVLDLCVDYFETNKYIFVHGWIPTIDNEYKYDKDWRSANKERWDKSRWQNPVMMFRNKVFEPNKTIVCGHWHCSAFWKEVHPDKYKEFGGKANFNPFITKNIIAVDACTSHSGKVNCIVLED